MLKTKIASNLLAIFYIILQIKQAKTQEKKDAINEIKIGLNKFLVLAPAK